MLTTVGSSGHAAPHQLAQPHRPALATKAPRLRSTTERAASPGCSACSCDGGAAFHVQKLHAQDTERGAPTPAAQAMLAAYHAHLAGHIRYFGPLTPVDLRV